MHFFYYEPKFKIKNKKKNFFWQEGDGGGVEEEGD